MNSIKINNQDVAVNTLPQDIQDVVERLTICRDRVKVHTYELHDAQVLYNTYLKILEEKVTNYVKDSAI